jgi:hypothetical protein
LLVNQCAWSRWGGEAVVRELVRVPAQLRIAAVDVQAAENRAITKKFALT